MHLTLSDPWFGYVKNGTKIYEGRRCRQEIRELKTGDTIVFDHHIDKSLDTFTKTVKHVHYFKSFEEGLLHWEKQNVLHQVLPNVPSVAEGVQIYLKYVSLETQIKDGVCFIELEG